MELKYKKDMPIMIIPVECFNRTFMELKFSERDWQERGFNVLIVPLWN